MQFKTFDKINWFTIKATLLLFILLLGVHITFAAEDYKPYLHKPSIGGIPKLQTFGGYTTGLFQGIASYAYAIDTPPSTNGLQPELSLDYNSQSALLRSEV